MTEESTNDKYWITDLRGRSVKSQYEIRFTLIRPPNNEKEIDEWLEKTFGQSGYIKKNIDSFYHCEIFFRKESDASMFILIWGESFT